MTGTRRHWSKRSSRPLSRSRRCSPRPTPCASWSATRGTTAIRYWWTWRPWASGPTSRNPIAAAATGTINPRPVTPSIGIAGAFAARAVSACCASAANGWKARLRISTKRAGCGAYTCGGHPNILKRVLLQAGALNLGLLMRQLVGIGTPRSLQGRAVALLRGVWALHRLPETLWNATWPCIDPRRRSVTYSRLVTIGRRTC